MIGWEKVQRGIFGPKREKVMLVGGDLESDLKLE